METDANNLLIVITVTAVLITIIVISRSMTTGTGLKTLTTVARNMADIRDESEEGRGSTFSFLLPIAGS